VSTSLATLWPFFHLFSLSLHFDGEFFHRPPLNHLHPGIQTRAVKRLQCFVKKVPLLREKFSIYSQQVMIDYNLAGMGVLSFFFEI
jgi:hypothetical protein